MKKDKIILLLFIVPLFLSTSFLKKRNTVEDKWRHVSTEFRGKNHPRNSGSLSEYEVRFSYTGFTSFYGEAPECPIRRNGKVVLTGLLSGEENVDADDDISYTGILQLDIDIDICDATGGSPAKLCGITVVGSGLVKTELEIQSDQRGGYIQIKDTTSSGFSKHVTGSCDQGEIAEERAMVPLKTIASVFNGMELPMLTQRKLHKGLYPAIHGALGKIEVEVLRVVRP